MFRSLPVAQKALQSKRRRRFGEPDHRKASRRLLLSFGVALGLLLIVFFSSPFLLAWQLHRRVGPPPPPLNAQSQALHSKLNIVDLHADSLLWNRDLAQRGSIGHVDLPRLTDGNVALQVFSVITQVPWGVKMSGNGERFDLITPLAMAQFWPPATWFDKYERALHQASRLRELMTEAPGKLLQVKSKSDLDRLTLARSQAQIHGQTRPVGALLALEGAQALGNDASRIDGLYQAGFRMVSPTHFTDTAFAGSAHGRSNGGLTEAGRELIRRSQAKGMIVDLAHASEQTIRDVLVMTRAPVVISHTGLKGTCDNPRNLGDDALRGIAATGGVVGIGFWPGAVCGNTVEAIVKAIRHAIEVAGVDHIAIGTDFDGAVSTPVDAAGLAHLTQALTSIGLSNEDIAKISGGNVLRVLAEVLPD